MNVSFINLINQAGDEMRIIKLLSILLFVTGCTHVLYPGKPTRTLAAPPVPEWVKSTNPLARSKDGYFRIIAEYDTTAPTVAGEFSSSFWETKKANFAITAKAKGLQYWDPNIIVPIYHRITTAKPNVFDGSHDLVTVVPLHPLGLEKFVPRVVYQLIAEDEREVKITELITQASTIAALFASSGNPVAAFAAKETTKAAANVLGDMYTDLSKSAQDISDLLIITNDSLAHGWSYTVPIMYFKNRETKNEMENQINNNWKESFLFSVVFSAEYNRSIYDTKLVKLDGEFSLPHADLTLADAYLNYHPSTQSSNPDPLTKSILEDLAATKTVDLEKLNGADPSEACSNVRTYILSKGYSPSDSAIIYGALLYKARNKNLQDIAIQNPDCLPFDMHHLLAKVYEGHISIPYDDEFVRYTPQNNKEQYLKILGDIREGLIARDSEKAINYFKNWFSDEITLTTYGDFHQEADGAVDLNTASQILSRLKIANAGCFMDGKHLKEDSGAAMIILNDSNIPGLVQLQFSTPQDAKTVRINSIAIKNITDYARKLGSDTNAFDKTSKCQKQIKNYLSSD